MAAHHVCRKSFMPAARHLTGNGITLCRVCHREAHAGFNGRSDLGLPMDAEGGEKLELLAHYYALLADHQERCGHPDRYFLLTQPVLSAFKIAQGFVPDAVVPGPPVRQAAHIWRAAPVQLITAVLRSALS